MADSPNNLPSTGAGKKKELTMEMRLLIAFILMGAVLFLTPYFYKPAKPVQEKPAAPVAKTEPAPEQKTAAPKPEASPQPAAAAATKMPGQAAAEKEDIIQIETELYRIELTNRGALIKHWILKNKKYVDHSGKPLDVVNQATVAKVGYPFGIEAKGQKLPVDVNQALYVAKRSPDGMGVEFEYSDGRVAVKKSLQFSAKSYLTQVSSEVLQNGVGVPHLIVWRGGFGDPTIESPASIQHSLHYNPTGGRMQSGELVVNEAKAAKDGPVSATGRFTFAGLEDHYFAAAFLPGANVPSIETVTYSDTAPVPATGKEEGWVGVAVGGAPQNTFALFVGPKDIELMKKIDPKLAQMIDWGWFWFLAEPLFFALNWTHDHIVFNYGWAIIVVTVTINLLTLPLRMSSMKSMKKMALIQPQIAAINEKYKGTGMRDPKRSEQNQEVMDLYKKNGVNPAGGCVPMLLQIPFFFAFYKVLTVAIELRGASWLWVSDLAMPETLPIRILPVAMVVSQFVQQKMTPSTSPDPNQQRIMMFMPLMLGFFFYSVSSGLVLYWLVGNLIGIAQQLVVNRMTPAPAVAVEPAVRKKGSRR